VKQEEIVITSSDIQSAYTRFYTYMMKYLWDINTTMDLAKLEIAIYKRFPDQDEMKECLYRLEKDIDDTYRDEDDPNSKDFKKKFEVLKDYIEKYNTPGFDIYRVEPELDLDEIKGESEEAHDDENIFDEENIGELEVKEEPEKQTKKKIKIGKIVRK